jgi:hypothetical protein
MIHQMMRGLKLQRPHRGSWNIPHRNHPRPLRGLPQHDRPLDHQTTFLLSAVGHEFGAHSCKSDRNGSEARCHKDNRSKIANDESPRSPHWSSRLFARADIRRQCLIGHAWNIRQRPSVSLLFLCRYPNPPPLWPNASFIGPARWQWMYSTNSAARV